MNHFSLTKTLCKKNLLVSNGLKKVAGAFATKSNSECIKVVVTRQTTAQVLDAPKIIKQLVLRPWDCLRMNVCFYALRRSYVEKKFCRFDLCEE
jgi:hypothetical protein